MIGDASGAKQPIPLVLAGRTWEVGVSTGSIGGGRIQPTSVFLSETFTQAGVHGPPLKRTETLSLSFRGRTAKGEVGYDAGQCSVSFTAARR